MVTNASGRVQGTLSTSEYHSDHVFTSTMLAVNYRQNVNGRQVPWILPVI